MHFQKTLSIFFTILLIFSAFVVPAFAVEYETQFPEYVTISGGAYFEVNSSLGQITFVAPNNYKDNTFGFTGSGNNICNCTNSTVSGYIYTPSGGRYTARFASLGTLEYRTSDTYDYQWVTLTVTEILNTNVNFIDDKLDRQTDNYFFDKYDIFLFVILIVMCSCSVLNLFFRKRRGNP
ncbi:MAG: hypothetical protein ACI35P_03045 [Bacillus sp. (in: firmicutes)]